MDYVIQEQCKSCQRLTNKNCPGQYTIELLPQSNKVTEDFNILYCIEANGYGVL